MVSSQSSIPSSSTVFPIEAGSRPLALSPTEEDCRPWSVDSWFPVKFADESVLADPEEGVEVVEELERVRLLLADLSRLSSVITSSIFIVFNRPQPV